jgi:hypothetical protein
MHHKNVVKHKPWERRLPKVSEKRKDGGFRRLLGGIDAYGNPLRDAYGVPPWLLPM